MIEDIVANNIILPVAEMHRKFVRKIQAWNVDYNVQKIPGKSYQSKAS